MAMNLLNPIQYLRGTKATIAQRTGKMGEMNYAYDVHELYAHDGVTPGGWLIGGGIPWWKETGEYNIYMSTTGSDDNDGLTPETAVASLAKAIQLTSRFVYGSCIPVINIAAGTYDIGYMRIGELCRSRQYIVIKGENRDTTIIQGMIESAGIVAVIHNISIAPRIDQLSLLSGITPAFTHVASCGVCTYNNVAVISPAIGAEDTTSYSLFCCDTNSFARITGESKIVGSSNYTDVIAARTCSSLALTGNLNLSGVCARVLNISYFGYFYFFANPSFTGSITGSKYWVGNFGLLNLGGRGDNVIPASSAGKIGDYGHII